MRHVHLRVQVLKLTQAQSDTIVEMRKVLLHKLGTVYDERRQLHLQVRRLLEALVAPSLSCGYEAFELQSYS